MSDWHVPVPGFPRAEGGAQVGDFFALRFKLAAEWMQKVVTHDVFLLSHQLGSLACTWGWGEVQKGGGVSISGVRGLCSSQVGIRK